MEFRVRILMEELGYIYICMCVCVCIYIYIYIYRAFLPNDNKSVYVCGIDHC